MASRDERGSYHEAGHNVVRVLLKGEAHCVTIDPRERPSAGAPPLPANLSDREIEEQVVELYAGLAAQLRFAPDEEGAALEGARPDEERASQLLALHSQTRSALLRDSLIQRSGAIVEAHWGAIEALAQEFLAHRRLDPSRVVSIVRANASPR